MQNQAKPNILFIEDEFFIRELYKEQLKKAGFNILTAIDGQEGLDLAEKSPEIKLILLDIMLPKINGIELLKIFKNSPHIKSIPIVLLTNLGDKDIIKEAFEIGAQGYLMKVRLTPNLLIDQIKLFLNNPTYKMDFKLLALDE